MRMFKWGGIRGVIDMLKTDRVNRMSGLHFVKVKEYYEHITPEILHTFISKIEIHEKVKDETTGKKTQNIDIYFTHVGKMS